ncbi:MAG: response regulator transcription factor [Anaerolineae bacterium]|nr:response regulator transcription factor [Anaerolineae bacterium]
MASEPEERPIRLWVAAPSPAVRAGLRALLEEDPHLKVNRLSASLLTQEEDLTGSFDLVILAPGSLPLEGLQDFVLPVLLLLESPPVRKLPYSVRGLLSIEAGSAELAAACRAIQAGLWVTQFEPGQSSCSENPSDPPEQDALTARELEVLQAMAGGFTNRQIAASLFLSENTVKFHVSSIYSKLGAVNRAEAVRLAARRGLLVL